MDRESRDYMTTSGEKPTAAAELFSMEQIELVKLLISQQQPHTVGAGSVAHSGLGFGEDDWQMF